MAFSEILREFMEEKGLNQVDVAKKSGFAQGQISAWLRGSRTPSYESLRRLCKSLEISPELMLALDTEKFMGSKN